MIGCTCDHKDPALCSCAHGSYCICFCHRQWKAPVVSSSEPGPRQPLDEKDAEIERLQAQVSNYRLVLNTVLVGLSNNNTPESVARAIAYIRKGLGMPASK